MRSRKTPHCSGGAQKRGKGTKGTECVGFSVCLPVGVSVICTDFDELGYLRGGIGESGSCWLCWMDSGTDLGRFCLKGDCLPGTLQADFR